MPRDLTLKAMNAAHRVWMALAPGRGGWRVGTMPVLELTTTGRRTGNPRRVLLTSPVQLGGTFVVVASRGGDDRPPAWLLNLQADPRVQVRLGDGPPRPARARVATPEERRELWPQVTSEYRGYARYQSRTAREIPLVFIEPEAASSPEGAGAATIAEHRATGTTPEHRPARGAARRPGGGTITTEIEVAAPPAAVWEALTDVTRWPERTLSMTSVEVLDGGTLGPGARVRIRQPKLPTMEWQVVACRPGESFVWTTSSPGVRTVATHAVTPVREGRSKLALGVHHHGPLAPLVRLLTGRLTRRYLAMEAAGHKAAAEAAAPRPGGART